MARWQRVVTILFNIPRLNFQKISSLPSSFDTILVLPFMPTYVKYEAKRTEIFLYDHYTTLSELAELYLHFH